MTQLYGYMYIEVNLLCVFLLLYVLDHLENSIEQQAENIALKRVVLSVMGILIVDCLWSIANGADSATARLCGPYLTSLFLFLEGVVALLWLEFTATRLRVPQKFTRKLRLPLLLLLAALFILSFLSPTTRWLFYYDGNNLYHRGELFFLQFIFPLFFILASAGVILWSIRRRDNRQDREEDASLLLFLVMPMVAFLVTLLCEGIPIIWPAAAVSLLLIFMSSQNYRISTDSLTGTNNRRQFDRHMNTLAGEQTPGRFACLLLMDIDDFKHINDTFGHYEGDRALIETADILKAICGHNDLFLARYGGDEFAILFSCGGEATIARLKKEIEDAFEDRNRRGDIDYPIRMSLGVGRMGPGFCVSVRELINSADRELYEEKSGKNWRADRPSPL